MTQLQLQLQATTSQAEQQMFLAVSGEFHYHRTTNRYQMQADCFDVFLLGVSKCQAMTSNIILTKAKKKAK